MVALGDSSCHPSAAARRKLGPLLCSSSRLCAEGMPPPAQGLGDGKEALTQPLRIGNTVLYCRDILQVSLRDVRGVWWLQANAGDGACVTSRELTGHSYDAVGALGWQGAEACLGSRGSGLAEVDPIPLVPPHPLVHPSSLRRCGASGTACKWLWAVRQRCLGHWCLLCHRRYPSALDTSPSFWVHSSLVLPWTASLSSHRGGLPLALLLRLSFLPHKLAVRGPRSSANGGPAAGVLFYRARSKGAAVVATVTSASLCDGVAHVWPKAAVLGVAWKMPSRGRRRRVGGLRAPFLGLSPPGHLACRRERLPLGHRDCRYTT